MKKDSWVNPTCIIPTTTLQLSQEMPAPMCLPRPHWQATPWSFFYRAHSQYVRNFELNGTSITRITQPTSGNKVWQQFSITTAITKWCCKLWKLQAARDMHIVRTLSRTDTGLFYKSKVLHITPTRRIPQPRKGKFSCFLSLSKKIHFRLTSFTFAFFSTQHDNTVLDLVQSCGNCTWMTLILMTAWTLDATAMLAGKNRIFGPRDVFRKRCTMNTVHGPQIGSRRKAATTVAPLA